MPGKLGAYPAGCACIAARTHHPALGPATLISPFMTLSAFPPQKQDERYAKVKEIVDLIHAMKTELTVPPGTA